MPFRHNNLIQEAFQADAACTGGAALATANFGTDAAQGVMETNMLLTMGIILLGIWLAGFVAFNVTAWFVHVLLFFALIALVTHVLRARGILRA